MSTFFITGATRGIGREIGLAAARAGHSIAVLGKTTKPHPILPGTIFTAVEDMEVAGGRAIAIETDVRDEKAVEAAVAQTLDAFGGIDVVVNNAGAIKLAPTTELPVRLFDRMMSVNVRAAWVTARATIPALRESERAHIVNLSPPLALDPKWLGPHVAYTISKYGMSLATIGLAEELRGDRIAVNSLWPRTAIATAALRMLPGIDENKCRTPEIMADALMALVARDPSEHTGRLLLDEEVLEAEGITDFSGYAVAPGNDLYPDLFVE